MGWKVSYSRLSSSQKAETEKKIPNISIGLLPKWAVSLSEEHKLPFSDLLTGPLRGKHKRIKWGVVVILWAHEVGEVIHFVLPRQSAG